MSVFSGDVHVTMQITFYMRKPALIYCIRQRFASLTLHCNSVFAIKAYGEESLNKLSGTDPDPDYLSRGPSHGYNTSCEKKSIQSEQWFFSYASGQTNRQTDPNALLSHSYPGARVKMKQN